MTSASDSEALSVSLMLNKTDNLEPCSLLWVDASANSNENRHAQQLLRSIFNPIRIFEDNIECETYIHQSKCDQILLIVSGHLGFDMIPFIHSLRQITLIYIYCLNSTKHKTWASKFTKIRAVVTDLNELIETIIMDREQGQTLFNEPLPIGIFNSDTNEERSSTNINGGYLHFQLLVDGLLHLPYNQASRNEFFAFCKKEYAGNDHQLSILRKFEQFYTAEKALHWYTRDSFLYRMLNKALRVQNIDVLFLFRFFMRDLYQQLEKLQQEQDQTPVRVYRGQLMSKEELDVLHKSKGEIISINSFLSTSLSRKKSLLFLSSKQNDRCCVLLEINADPRSSDRKKPFANISAQSQFVNEQEHLFMIGSSFRVLDICQEDRVTVIQMQLCNENYNHDTQLLFEHMQKESERDDECLSLGHILRTAGMYDKAEEFYRRRLSELPNNHPLIADLLGSIGLVKKAKGELDVSSHWINRSFKEYEKMGDRHGIAKCLQNLADINQMQGEFQEAINKYKQALNIFQEFFGDQHKSVATCLNNLGANYFEQHMFNEAVRSYTDALNIRKTLLPHIHPDIAMTINNIGNVCFVSGEYDAALRYFERALDIYKISLPSEHPSVAQTYQNMGLAYCRKGEYQLSLPFLDRAASIRLRKLSPNHPDVHRSTEIINYVRQKLSQSQQQ